MATTYKVLGQSNPAATTLTTLYTVPASTQTVISTITVANQAATAATYPLVSIKPSALLDITFSFFDCKRLFAFGYYFFTYLVSQAMY